MGQCAKGITHSEYKEEEDQIDNKSIPHVTWSELCNAVEHELYSTMSKQILKVVTKYNIEWKNTQN